MTEQTITFRFLGTPARCERGHGDRRGETDLQGLAGEGVSGELFGREGLGGAGHSMT